MQRSAEVNKADLILVDLGPNLGALNRAGLIASDFVVIPLSPDLYSLQGLRNLGPTLRRWRRDGQIASAESRKWIWNCPLGLLNRWATS